MNFCKKLCLVSILCLNSVIHSKPKKIPVVPLAPNSVAGAQDLTIETQNKLFFEAINAAEGAAHKKDTDNLNIQLTTAKTALKNGANINIKDHAGAAALLRAAFNNNVETVTFLLENNANPNLSKDKDGTTPLSWAVENGNMAIAEKLLKKGADPRVENTRGEPLIDVARYYQATRWSKNPEMKMEELLTRFIPGAPSVKRPAPRFLGCPSSEDLARILNR